jgi:hypothetical protein
MKKRLLVGLTLVLIVCACRKNMSSEVVPQPRPHAHSSHDTTRTTPPDTTKADTTKPVVPGDTTKKVQPPYPVASAAAPPAPSCPIAPIYGDTIIYTQPTNGADYIFHPVNSPGQGKYFSWPQGMVIDVNTGAINLSKSETGMKYAIGFVKNGSTDTCMSTLVVGGVDYMDSIYVLSNGATTALPYFDANPYLPSICAGNACTFDVNGTAANSKVIVNGTTGVIDLQQTLNGGLLGGAFGLIPQNGASVTTAIYYKLNDPSNNALQHISVQIVYYNTKADITNSNPSLVSGILNAVNNLLAGHLISNTANPRPPLIVIVRRLN